MSTQAERLQRIAELEQELEPLRAALRTVDTSYFAAIRQVGVWDAEDAERTRDHTAKKNFLLTKAEPLSAELLQLRYEEGIFE